jgi:hypothetical protein
LHHDLSKINGLIAEHADKQQTLADDNFIMEHDFVFRLKELEAEAVGMEQQIVALKEQKVGLLLDVVEAEKQHMLIEKKIALERETQAALDPEVGAAEVRAMEREIHRMRLRYSQLQRRQLGTAPKNLRSSLSGHHQSSAPHTQDHQQQCRYRSERRT